MPTHTFSLSPTHTDVNFPLDLSHMNNHSLSLDSAFTYSFSFPHTLISLWVIRNNTFSLHTITNSLSITQSHTITLSLYKLSITLSLSLSFPPTLSFSLSLSHPHVLSLSISLSLSHTTTLSLYLHTIYLLLLLSLSLSLLHALFAPSQMLSIIL